MSVQGGTTWQTAPFLGFNNPSLATPNVNLPTSGPVPHVDFRRTAWWRLGPTAELTPFVVNVVHSQTAFVPDGWNHLPGILFALYRSVGGALELFASGSVWDYGPWNGLVDWLPAADDWYIVVGQDSYYLNQTSVDYVVAVQHSGPGYPTSAEASVATERMVAGLPTRLLQLQAGQSLWWRLDLDPALGGSYAGRIRLEKSQVTSGTLSFAVTLLTLNGTSTGQSIGTWASDCPVGSYLVRLDVLTGSGTGFVLPYFEGTYDAERVTPVPEMMTVNNAGAPQWGVDLRTVPSNGIDFNPPSYNQAVIGHTQDSWGWSTKWQVTYNEDGHTIGEHPNADQLVHDGNVQGISYDGSGELSTGSGDGASWVVKGGPAQRNLFGVATLSIQGGGGFRSAKLWPFMINERLYSARGNHLSWWADDTKNPHGAVMSYGYIADSDTRSKPLECYLVALAQRDTLYDEAAMRVDGAQVLILLQDNTEQPPTGGWPKLASSVHTLMAIDPPAGQTASRFNKPLPVGLPAPTVPPEQWDASGGHWAGVMITPFMLPGQVPPAPPGATLEPINSDPWPSRWSISSGDHNFQLQVNVTVGITYLVQPPPIRWGRIYLPPLTAPKVGEIRGGPLEDRRAFWGA